MRSFTSLSSSILLMTTLALLALIEVRPTFAPPQSSSSSSSSEDEIVTDAAINGEETWRNEYEYVDLDDMSDDQLAEICTSRGFKLATDTETNDDSDDQINIVHTHQYYVDAAWECLQMEADMMNETIQALPEIIKDVQREDEHIGQDRESSLPDQEQHSQQYYEQQQQTQQYQEDFGTTTSNNSTITAIYNVKEITQEVIQQIKKDVTKIINFLTPSPEVQQMLREQQVKLRVFYKQHIIPTLKEEVIPALKSFAVVVKDWGMTVVDMTRRYIQATLMEKNGQRHGGSDHDGDDDETVPNRNDKQSSNSGR